MSRVFAVRPSEWEADHYPAIRAAELYQASHDGALPVTPMWRALERRHDLNPVRFDRWHPNIGLMIERAECGVTGVGLASLAVRDDAPAIASASVPEPSTLALWCVGLALVYLAVGVWNYRRVLTTARDVIDGVLERSEAS